MMRLSIKSKVFVLVSVIVFLFILLLSILLATSYKSYVFMMRKNDILSAYNKINKFNFNDNSNIYDALENLEYKYNLKLTILTPTNDYFYDRSPEPPNMRSDRKDGLNILQSEINQLPQKKTIFIKTFDKRLNMEFVLFLGRLDNGYYTIVRLATPHVGEGVKYTIVFVLFSGLIALIICLFIAYYVAKKITNPILEITNITEKMAKLDFTQKCSYISDDELGKLSSNVNKLSNELEKNIKSLKLEIEKERKIDQMRKDLIINISHELKTPIFLIQSYAEGLKENIIKNEIDKDYYCDVIADEITRMDNMVQELLGLATIEAGKQKYIPAPIKLMLMVNRILQSNEISIQGKGINLNVDIDKEVIVIADEEMLERAVRNLIINAIDHVSVGGIIRITAQNDGERDDKIRISIYNSGSCIPEEDLDKIWQSFYKVDKSRKRCYGGTGIGLSIVKAVIEAHHGTYGAVNEDDGVTFFITLKRG